MRGKIDLEVMDGYDGLLSRCARELARPPRLHDRKSFVSFGNGFEFAIELFLFLAVFAFEPRRSWRVNRHKWRSRRACMPERAAAVPMVRSLQPARVGDRAVHVENFAASWGQRARGAKLTDANT